VFHGQSIMDGSTASPAEAARPQGGPQHETTGEKPGDRKGEPEVKVP
jgi:hypothetical protein